MVALQTFKNLTPQRQAEVIRACLEEFALKDYRSASIAPILEKLKIAKGSFYRYFESKQSLYYYLLEHCIEKRLSHDQDLKEGEITDFFELTYHHLKSKIHFDQQEPLESMFLFQVQKEENSDELPNIEQFRKTKILEITEGIVKQFIEKGQLRGDLDPKIMAWTVLQNQFSFQEFIQIKFQQDFQKNISEKARLYDLPEDQLLKYGLDMINILKEGLLKSR